MFLSSCNTTKPIVEKVPPDTPDPIKTKPVEEKTPRKTPESTNKPFTPAFTVPEVKGDYYYDSLKLIEEKDPKNLDSIDFVKFRYAYLVVRDRDNLSVPNELEQNLRKSVRAGNNEEVLTLCEQILKYDYTDIYTHVMRNYALEQKGEDMSFFREYVYRLVDSITKSGDGQTPETAFHVSQVKEEYALLKFLGLQSTRQSLITIDQHSFDVLMCSDEKGNQTKLYFDITEHMAAIMKKLGL
jgi:hypothetical protein